MFDLLLTPQTLVGTVSGAAITLILTACAQRVSWGFSAVARGQPKREEDARSRAAAPPSLSAFGGQVVDDVVVKSAAPAADDPAPQPTIELKRQLDTMPPRVLAHYHDGLKHKTRVAPVKAARILIDFMQGHGASGYFTPGEINEWWRWACAELNLDPLHPDVVRAELAALPNVWKPNTRLNAPEYRAVKARTGKERSILYRIPAARADAGGVAGAARDSWADAGKATGQRPASAKKASKSGMVSGSELYQEAA